MELDYVLTDPTGNVTALVKTPFPVSQQPALAAALMAAEPAAEQAGFLSHDADADIALRMAGGEFCGNAAMSAAVLWAEANRLETGSARVRVSGAAQILRIDLERRAEGGWLCTEHLPLCPEPETVSLQLEGRGCRLPLLRLGGIAHLILPGDIDRAGIERAVPAWCAALGVDALGCMLLNASEGRMDPLVYVPGAKTLFWERSCASGSAAAGAYLAWQRGGRVSAVLTQPGGTLYVEAAPVGEILLRGAVRVIKVGKILVK